MVDGRVVIRVDSNAEKASRDFNKLDKSVDRTASSAEDASKSFINLRNVVAGIATVATLQALSNLSKNLISVASDAEETANKFNVTFSSIQADAEQTASVLASSFGLARDEAQALLADTGDLLTGFGFSQESALSLSKQVQELAVDLASFTNFAGGAVGASDALTKALLGEREAAKALGVAILEEDVKARVARLEAQGRFIEETEREKRAIATLDIAVEQSKNAIGDFARSQESFANQTRIAQSTVRDLKVALGEELLPLATSAVSSFNDLAVAIRTAFAPGREDRLKQIAFELNDASLELREFTEEFNSSFLRNFDKLDATSTPAFRALTERIRELKKEQEELTRVSDESVSKAEADVQPAVKGTSDAYADLTSNIKDLENELRNLALAGESGTLFFSDLQEQLRLSREELDNANKALEDFGSTGKDDIDAVDEATESLASRLANDIVTPLRDGESAFLRFGLTAISVIQDVAQEIARVELLEGFQKLAKRLGLTSFGDGGGDVSANAKGNAFGAGVKKYAAGGAFGGSGSVVSSPTFFNDGSGLAVAGEAGPEGILPLKRTSQGDLGVQAEGVTQPIINIINNSNASIQEVSNGRERTDIIISEVNSALSSSRTDSAFRDAQERQSNTGALAF